MLNIMKKIRLFLLPLMALSVLSVSCKEDEIEPQGPGNGTKVVATFTQTELISAVDDYYQAWVAEPVIPETMEVSGKELTFPQYVYAFAKLIVDLKDGKTTDVDVLNFKAPSHPERDSYDKEEIAVFNNEKGEDLGTIATKMLDAMDTKGEVPNQTLIDRNGTSLAFSTNRAAVTFARAISAYKGEGSMPATVTTDYLSTSATIKGFASQVVQYMRKWEETVGTVSADGSHNSGRVPPNPWENAHFIPIPWHPNCAVAADGEDQYHIQYQPYLEIEVAGQKYNAAQALGVGLAALLDLVTVEGSAHKQTVITEPVHTPGNGANINSPIPALHDGYAWGPYPWYENAQENGPLMINGEPAAEVGIDFIIKIAPWLIARATGDLGRYPNYFTFGEGSLELEGYTGYCCPMRAFVISLRFWDYIVKNNITEKFYDALKDVKVAGDLYGSEQPPLALDKDKAVAGVDGETITVTVTSKEETWTATVEGDFLTVDPMQGNAGATEVKITVAANQGAARSGKVSFTTASGSVKQINISQDSTPNFASIADFVSQAVTYLDVWKNTVGTVKADGTKTFTDAHFIPIPFRDGASGGDNVNQYDHAYQPYHTITVGGQELNAAQTYGTAVSVLVDLLTVEGTALRQEDQNVLVHTPGNGKKLSDVMPIVEPYFNWGPHPWYEVAEPISYNGEEMTEADIDFVLRIAPWVVVKKAGVGEPLNPAGRYPNFYTFGSGSITYEGYEGYLSPMRMFLITLRYLDYIVKNNITENVYDALKDVKVSADLYGLGQKVTSIEDFAKEAVTYLDVWESTVGDVSADGSHSIVAGTPNPWTNVHFIPIPWHANCSVAADGQAQYAEQYKPYHTITVGESTLDAAQTCGVAIASLVELLTAEGNATMQAEIGTVVHTLANGKPTSAPMPEILPNYAWGPHPWYESTSEEGPLFFNGNPAEEVGVDFFLSYGPWFLKKSTITGVNATYPNGRYPNYFIYGSGYLSCEGFSGYACPMRLFLISLRFLDYIVENNITENVYDALKDVKVSAALY